MRIIIPNFCSQECDMFASPDKATQCRGARLAQILNNTERVIPKTNGIHSSGKDMAGVEASMSNCAAEQQAYRETGFIQPIFEGGQIITSCWGSREEAQVTRLAESIRVLRRNPVTL